MDPYKLGQSHKAQNKGALKPSEIGDAKAQQKYYAGYKGK